MFIIDGCDYKVDLIYCPQDGEEINNPVYHAICTTVCERLHDKYEINIKAMQGIDNYYQYDYCIKIEISGKSSSYSITGLYDKHIEIINTRPGVRVPIIKICYEELDFNNLINLMTPKA